MNPGKRALSTPIKPASKREAHFETPKIIRQKIRSLLSSSGSNVQTKVVTLPQLRNTRTAGQVTSSIEVNKNRNNQEVPISQEVKFMRSKPVDNLMNPLNFLRTGTEL